MFVDVGGRRSTYVDVRRRTSTTYLYVRRRMTTHVDANVDVRRRVDIDVTRGGLAIGEVVVLLDRFQKCCGQSGKQLRAQREEHFI